MYRIRFFNKAKEYLGKVSFSERDFILNEIYKLESNPYSHPKMMPLKGYKKLWKFYIKEHRAIIKILLSGKDIVVLSIGHRRDVYKNFFEKGKK